MKRTKTRFFCLIFFAALARIFPQAFMNADTAAEPYALIESNGYGYEVPDCGHAVKHITTATDDMLRKPVFVFHIHRDLDDDRCINFDRQRNEIKTWSPSPDSMKGHLGETHTYRWKFKLAAGFQPSANFTHIHQLKAGDGTIDTDSPLMTITPRKGSPNRLELIFTEPVEAGGNTIKLITVELQKFIGVWVEAVERVTYGANGKYSLQLRDVENDSLLLDYTNANIALWRTGITFVRPKYGIYRSLNDIASLRDEQVRFADFYLYEGAALLQQPAPAGLTAEPFSVREARLAWQYGAVFTGMFRIERSSDNTDWRYLASVPPSARQYPDTGLTAGKKYYYRLRAENACGNTGYSNTAAATTLSGAETPSSLPPEFRLNQNFPNPFNPRTVIRYSLPVETHTRMEVFDVTGRIVAVLAEGYKAAGNHTAVLDASALPAGIYLYRLTAGNYSAACKLSVMK